MVGIRVVAQLAADSTRNRVNRRRPILGRGSSAPLLIRCCVRLARGVCEVFRNHSFARVRKEVTPNAVKDLPAEYAACALLFEVLRSVKQAGLASEVARLQARFVIKDSSAADD